MKSELPTTPSNLKLSARYFADKNVKGAMTRSEPVVPSSVYPSALALTTAIALIEPEAPATFSVTIVCPRLRSRVGFAERMEASEGPPAGNAALIVIGRDG